MNKSKIVIVLSMMLIFLGCSKTDKQNEIDKKEIASINNEKNLQTATELFDYNYIGLQIGFVEKKFNILPMHKEDDSATYMIGNCEITLGLDSNKNIKSISFLTINECILNIENGNSDTVKLGDIMLKAHKDNLPGTFIVTCPSSCGRTQEPEYTYIANEGSISGFQSISYTSRNPDGIYEWEEKIKRKLNVDALDDNLSFTNNDELFNEARTMLKKGDIHSISIFIERP